MKIALYRHPDHDVIMACEVSDYWEKHETYYRCSDIHDVDFQMLDESDPQRLIKNTEKRIEAERDRHALELFRLEQRIEKLREQKANQPTQTQEKQ